eukprot:TRINITY_DN193_c0_g1_i1.p1 TRINITY_DN193_c0_g1~~TRINITY_DN193_c0_g1_i1.p1  ORF type:complete len:506 (+),score=88.09 TRINITY_DN193_c0_g1_i1:59-1576(+)
MTSLGLQNPALISDACFSTSSTFANFEPPKSRLNSRTCWGPATATQGHYLQVSLPTITEISAVSTQGRPEGAAHWVTQYLLSYSDDGITFAQYPTQFAGNTDCHTVVTRQIDPPIKARYVRIIPMAWNGHPLLRWDLVGKQVSKFPDDRWYTGTTPLTSSTETLDTLRAQCFTTMIPGIRRLNIAVFGMVGVGKSSLHNSIQLALRGYHVDVAPVRAGMTDSCTTSLSKIALHDQNDASPMVWDLPGFKDTTYQGDEFSRILRGHWRNGYNPTVNESMQQHFYIPNPTLDDRAHVLIMVVNAMRRDVDAEMALTSRYIRAAEALPIPVLVAVSHIDQVDDTKEVLKSPFMAYRSIKIRDAVAIIARKLGLPQANFVPLMNAHSSETIETVQRDIVVLNVLQCALAHCQAWKIRPELVDMLERHQIARVGVHTPPRGGGAGAGARFSPGGGGPAPAPAPAPGGAPYSYPRPSAPYPGAAAPAPGGGFYYDNDDELQQALRASMQYK